jgi:hypothetical protein
MNPHGAELVKRGWPAQRERREADRVVRRRVVGFDRWARRRGLSHREVAAQLGIPMRTLRHWQQGWGKDHLAAKPRGRPCQRGDVASRNAAIHLVTLLGPRTGLGTLHAACPGLARGELQDIQRRFRRLWRHDHRRLIRVLHWQRAGTVWAMDHTEPPQPVEGRWPHMLAVRDLASGMQLGWLPVELEDGRTTCRALADLFRRHGPPLVLKSDNGSGFIGGQTELLLSRWDVFPLFSPAHTPEYNGSCEAGNGAMKIRSAHQAILHDRPGQWTVADVERAQQIANHVHRPCGYHGLTAGEVWRGRAPITAAERAAFGRTVRRQRHRARDELGYPQDQPLGRKAQAQIDRLAIRRACVEHGLLTWTRRSITPPITAHFPANIS